ncbi:hypothetical protein CKAH01_18503 [Colletotrichum kahawae]|uniref:Uncharacterized protein n=1 Tax=Colletotrichum kahawae TaxID=34407 RepID=A0AAD9Y5B6_COLKA|nr:hypothetical protein CKAH01_18503 [Colletotrichum kahawae]
MLRRADVCRYNPSYLPAYIFLLH